MIYVLEAIRPGEPPFTVSAWRTRRKAKAARLHLFRTHWNWCLTLSDLRISKMLVS